MGKAIGSAFIDIMGRGFQKVQTDLDKVKNGLKSTQDYGDKLKSSFARSSLNMSLKVDKSQLDQIKATAPATLGLDKSIIPTLAFGSLINGISKVNSEAKLAHQSFDNLQSSIGKVISFGDKKGFGKSGKDISDAMKPTIGDMTGTPPAYVAPEIKSEDGEKDPIGKLKAQIAGLPKETKLYIIVEKINALEKDITKMQGGLTKFGAIDKNLMKLAFAKNLKKDLQGLQGQVQASSASTGDMNSNLTKIGSLSTKVFVGGIAAVTGFVKAADPLGFENFQLSLFKLSIQLGKGFVPELRAVTEWVERLVAKFKADEAFRGQVMLWSKLTLAAAGIGMILPRIISVVKGLGTAFTLLTSNPLLALAAAVVGLMLATDEGKAQLGDFLSIVTEGFQNLISFLKPAFEWWAEALQNPIGKWLILGAAVVMYVPRIIAGVRAIAMSFATLGGAITGALGLIGLLISLFVSFNSMSVGEKAGRDYVAGLVKEIRAGRKDVQQALADIRENTISEYYKMKKGAEEKGYFSEEATQLRDLQARTLNKQMGRENTHDNLRSANLAIQANPDAYKPKDAAIMETMREDKKKMLDDQLEFENKHGAKPKDDKNKRNEAGEVRAKPSQFMGNVEAFKKLSQGFATLEERKYQEQLDQARKTADGVAQTNKWLQQLLEKGPMAMVFGD